MAIDDRINPAQQDNHLFLRSTAMIIFANLILSEVEKNEDLQKALDEFLEAKLSLVYPPPFLPDQLVPAYLQQMKILIISEFWITLWEGGILDALTSQSIERTTHQVSPDPGNHSG